MRGSDLFAPGTDVLSRLADYCTARLAPTLADAFFSDGAEPRAENYRNWNLTSTGLVVEYNEYQVAPYAAGPQTVEIQFEALGDILRSDERLAAVRGR